METKTKLVKRQAGALTQAVVSGAVPIVGGLGAIWTISAINWVVFGGGLSAYSIAPWTMNGLLGIFVAPFLHSGLPHLLGNTTAFLMLAPLTMLRKRMDFWVVSVVGMLSSGLFTWVFGGLGTVHIGVSGVIFAYLGFLMARGFFQRSWATLAFSMFMVWMFSGLLWGLLPVLAGVGISWQGHLGGFIGGVLVARLLGNSLREQNDPNKRLT